MHAESKAATPRAWIGAIAFCAALAIVGAYVAPWLHYVFKPLTTLLIAAMVWRHGGVAEPGYRRSVLAGLLLSTCGDAFLMLPGDWFVFGLGSFLCAHIAYLLGLFGRARPFAVKWPFLAYAALAAAVLCVLWPHLPGELRIPVIVYVVVLAAMAAQAAAVWRRWPVRATAMAALGGAFFVASDATLAIDRFAAPFEAASLAVLATYWIAQTLIGLSVRSLEREQPVRPE
ncbi:lysoplasmalogenase [Lysobacter sp. CA199]|uniref:lysoplasmalogenase n=1 Tax=Lysobacter sp. CA199 TaxID=3455608 RepID=UPI003F8D35B7